MLLLHLFFVLQRREQMASSNLLQISKKKYLISNFNRYETKSISSLTLVESDRIFEIIFKRAVEELHADAKERRPHEVC